MTVAEVESPYLNGLVGRPGDENIAVMRDVQAHDRELVAISTYTNGISTEDSTCHTRMKFKAGGTHRDKKNLREFVKNTLMVASRSPTARSDLSADFVGLKRTQSTS